MAEQETTPMTDASRKRKLPVVAEMELYGGKKTRVGEDGEEVIEIREEGKDEHDGQKQNATDERKSEASESVVILENSCVGTENSVVEGVDEAKFDEIWGNARESEAKATKSPWVSREEHDKVRGKANDMLKNRKAENKQLQKEIADLKKSFEERVENEIEDLEHERDRFEAKTLSLQVKIDSLAKNQEEYNTKCMEIAKGWKKNEINRRIEYAEAESNRQLSNAKKTMEKRYKTQETRHRKEQETMKEKVQTAKTELKQERESIRIERKKMNEDQRAFLRDNKPENIQKVKDLERVVKEKDTQIADLNDELCSAEDQIIEDSRTISRLRQEQEAYRMESQTLSTQLDESHTETMRLQAELQEHVFETKDLKEQHEAELRAQSSRYEIQRSRSSEDEQRVVDSRRVIFVLKRANETLTRERKGMERRVVEAEAEVRRLKAIGEGGGEESEKNTDSSVMLGGEKEQSEPGAAVVEAEREGDGDVKMFSTEPLDSGSKMDEDVQHASVEHELVDDAVTSIGL